MQAESRERGVFTPALTYNRCGREKEGRSAAEREAVIAGGEKLCLGGADQRHHNWHRRRRGNGGETSQQRVLLDLGDQAVMVRALSILVEKMMQFGRNRKGERSEPYQ